MDWNIFQSYSLSLSRFDLCYSRTNDSNHTKKSLDKFLVDSRSQIQSSTNPRHISLKNDPKGDLNWKLKNLEPIRFKSKFDQFEYQFTELCYQYSEIDNSYTDWLVNLISI